MDIDMDSRSACGRVEKYTADPHDFDWTWKLLRQKSNSKLFSKVKIKWEFRLNEDAFLEFWIGPRSTKWSFENASQRWKMWKTQGFEHFSFNMAEKNWRQLQGGESADSLVYGRFNI